MTAIPEYLKLDLPEALDRIISTVSRQVREVMKKRGSVVAVSGGIDSAVCAALCVRALGPDRVFLLLMPERDSSRESLEMGKNLANMLGTIYEVENIQMILEQSGCYLRQTEAIREVVPEYGKGWKFKIILPSILEGKRLNLSRLVVRPPAGDEQVVRMPAHVYSKLVAATNMKQRTRTAMAYYHADRLNYAVCGTPNRLEYDQGFFVKGGDGFADFKPIAHLYKTQVYQLADVLGLPEEIRLRPPTTDTFSLPQSQEEFYFSLPYQAMDICLYGHNHSIPPSRIAQDAGLTAEQAERVYADIENKRRSTRYLHVPPLLVEPVDGLPGK